MTERFTDLRITRIGADRTSAALPLIVPLIAGPLIGLGTMWRYRRAIVFAEGSDTVNATVKKITLFGVGVHRRVTLEYEYQGRAYKIRERIYDSIVSTLRVGQQIEIQVFRKKPKRIRFPQNMELM